MTAEQSVQSNEHEPTHPREGATIVIWDPRLPGSFPPASRTSILLAWWHSKACYCTYGVTTYMKLKDHIAIGGAFMLGDPQSDDMEGLPIWNPTNPEMIQERMRRLNLIRRRCIAILTKEVDSQRATDAQAAAVADDEAADFLTDDDSDDDIWETAAFHSPPIAMHVPLLPPGFGWGEGGFIPGRGFAQLPARPAL